MLVHLTMHELLDKFSRLLESPSDNGIIDLIVARPSKDERKVLTTAELTCENGLVGDSWKNRNKKPNPKTQITLMNSSFIEMIAGGKENWPLAGDQLYVNLDISKMNLPPGQKVAIGPDNNVILEITDIAHNGCSKFSARFGSDTLRFINAPERKDFRLRGVYAKVIKPGSIKISDPIKKM